MKIRYFLLLSFLVGGCSDIEEAPKLSFDYVQLPIQMTEFVTGDWDKLCILGPYSDNQLALQVLGFEWQLESLSSVWINDGVTLLIFVKRGKVESYFEVTRSPLDFNSLDEQCFIRNEAVFNVEDGAVVAETQV
jgi:hypothetical protein